MQRRGFLQLPAAAAAAAAVSSVPAQAAKSLPPAKMVIGHQHVSDEVGLRFLSCWGVKNICSAPISRQLDDKWSVSSLKQLKERVATHGISLDMVPLPMSSSEIGKAESPNILLGKDPERDREIDGICQMIRNCAEAGIPAVKYNFTFLGVVRTEASQGRGASKNSTFVFAKAKPDPAMTIAGPVPDDLYWERIDYFLKKVVPVANENKVRIACHPQDPGMPHKEGYRGVNTVLGSIAGLKKFVSMHESPYHGFNFCQGTVSEMLENPAVEIHDAIRYFGSRKKIFNVHFRNIRGKFLDFQETFPDDGDVDMLAALRTYREVGYDKMIMPDHVPKIDGDEAGRAAFAFCFGYIQAALQMVRRDS